MGSVQTRGMYTRNLYFIVNGLTSFLTEWQSSKWLTIKWHDMKQIIHGKPSEDDRIFSALKPHQSVVQTSSSTSFSSSECDSEPEEAKPNDGFGWVDMPQNDIMVVECWKFIPDELKIDPSSRFTIPTRHQQQLLPLVPTVLIGAGGQWVGDIPNLTHFNLCKLHGKLGLININLLQRSRASPQSPPT